MITIVIIYFKYVSMENRELLLDSFSWVMFLSRWIWSHSKHYQDSIKWHYESNQTWSRIICACNEHPGVLYMHSAV